MKKYFKFVLLAAVATAPALAFSPTMVAQEKSAEKQDSDQEEELSLEERMQESMGLYQEGEVDEAIEMVTEIYADFPEDERVGMTLIQMQQRAGADASQEERELGNKYYYASGKTARMLIEDDDVPEQAISTMIATAIYNEACCFGVDGKKEEAMKVLKEAFELGFEEFDLAAEDGDFGDLLETDEYQSLVKKYRELAPMRAMEKLKKEIADFEAFDFNFETENMDGDDISLAGFKGKIVIVDFWGTWCPPCRAEIPHYVELKKKFADKIEIVGLAYERGDDEEAYDNVVEFMEDHDINYECALGDEDTKDMVPDFRGFPTTVFIDAEGQVRFMKVGATEYDRLETIVMAIMEEE